MKHKAFIFLLLLSFALFFYATTVLHISPKEYPKIIKSPLFTQVPPIPLPRLPARVDETTVLMEVAGTRQFTWAEFVTLLDACQVYSFYTPNGPFQLMNGKRGFFNATSTFAEIRTAENVSAKCETVPIVRHQPPLDATTSALLQMVGTKQLTWDEFKILLDACQVSELYTFGRFMLVNNKHGGFAYGATFNDMQAAADNVRAKCGFTPKVLKPEFVEYFK